MSRLIPLLRCWHIEAETLPEELLPQPSAASFSLPGAAALCDFAELLGDSPGDAPSDPQPAARVPFALPAMIPDSIPGSVTLRCEIDFGAFRGDYAVLTIDHIAGRGSILLGDQQIAAFDGACAHRAIAEAFDLSAYPCMLAVDLSGALQTGRRETLSIRFDDARPAGICGPVMLHTARLGRLSRVSITPDPAQKLLTLHAQLTAMHPGKFILRAQPVHPDGSGDAIRSLSCRLQAGETTDVNLSLFAALPAFSAGTPYAPGAMKITLLYQKEGASYFIPCDGVTLMCGYPGKAPGYALPLTGEEAMLAPDMLLERLRPLCIPAVRLAAPAPDAFCRAMTRAGIAVRMSDNIPLRQRLERIPCACFAAERVGEYGVVSAEGSAWQMGSMVQLPRPVDPSMTAAELVREIAGMPVDPARADAANTLAQLRAVCIRMRAEAARQGHYSGALCAPGEWAAPDIAESLRTAFAPMHISAQPLYGAWWVSSRFSASIQAFIPGGAYTANDPLIVCAALEDADGLELARLRAPCRCTGGYIGVLEAQLPEHACVLTLRTSLTLHGDVLEESSIPVYVGERGPLEAAFK